MHFIDMVFYQFDLCNFSVDLQNISIMLSVTIQYIQMFVNYVSIISDIYLNPKNCGVRDLCNETQLAIVNYVVYYTI